MTLPRRQLFALLLAPLAAAPARRRIPPGDESAMDPSFAVFWAKLKKAAAQRDRAALRALSVPDLEIDPADLPELDRALALGAGRFDKGFSFPYFVAKFPEDVDPYEHAVVLSPKAVLRSRPDGASAPVAPLDHDIVHIAAWKPNAQWQQARRLDGAKGYVNVADIRTCGHHHGYCEKRAGAWKLIAFDQGD